VHTSAIGRAISPIDLRQGRPIHERKESDVSDIGTSPFPSPNPEAHDEQSALPSRPKSSRVVSGEGLDAGEEHPTRTL
jgi:hypothetical protein